MPVLTEIPKPFKDSINFSYKGMAISGLADCIKLGLFPFFVDAKRVN